MSNNFNFFTEGMKDFMNPENLTKNFKNVSMPDFSQVSDSVKRNSEVLTEIGQMAAESAQAIMRRGAEIIQDNASNTFNNLKEVAASGNPEDAMSRQQSFAQNFMQQTASNVKEMMDMSSKAMMEVFERVSNHTQCNVSHAMACNGKNKK